MFEMNGSDYVRSRGVSGVEPGALPWVDCSQS